MVAAALDVEHLLIFEPDGRGHAAEWIEHLMRTIERDRFPSAVTLAVPISLADEIVAGRTEQWQAAIRVRPLRRWESALCNSRVLALSGLARWWTMRRHMRQSSADHGLFLSIDHLTLPLALGLGFAGRQVTGILFRPSVHYSHPADRAPPMAERIREVRKRLLYRLTLRNPAVRAIRSLDPYFPAYAARHFPHSEKLRAVVDPAHPADFDVTERSVDTPRAPTDRTLFVLFGVLGRRKGILKLVEALRRLEPRYASAIAIHAAGEVEPAVAGELREALAELADIRPELWLRIEDRRLSVAEIVALMRRADVVLAPYQRFVGSSGVLLWAAKAGKPVITQDYGLVGRFVREYGLGLAVDTSDPSDLAAAIAAAVRRGPRTLADPDGMGRFVGKRTPDAFATSVLEGISGTSALRGFDTRQDAVETTATD